MPDQARADAFLSVAIAGLALATAALRLLDADGLLTRASAAATTTVLLAGSAIACVWFVRRSTGRTPYRFDPVAVLAVGLAVIVMAAAALAAAWLPVWQWDALGYHLPFVNFLLQPGRHVAIDDPYVAGYPHHAEYLFVGWRSLFANDRWIDAAQLPLGAVGAVAVAALARRAGARRADACAAGALWLAVPIVFLQLPSNYVDLTAGSYFLVAAYFVTRDATPGTVAVGATAIALLLGCKPSAPPACLVLALVLWRRAAVAGLGRGAAAALALALVCGGEPYVRNLVVHGNPLWPVSLHLGPLTLPGPRDVSAVLASAAHLPRPTGSLPARLLRAWLHVGGPPSYDMRLGGFGPLFPPALVGLVAWTIRRRDWRWVALGAAAIAVPDPSVARYTLALPGLALAASAAAIAVIAPPLRLVVGFGAIGCAAWGAWHAAPGLRGEGPPLTAYASMSPVAREGAVGADGRPAPFVAARNRLAAGENAAYDSAFELPYLLWRSDLANRVARVPDDATVADAQQLLDRERVRLLVGCDDGAAGRLATTDAPHWLPLFSTRTDRCTVFWRR